jgi:hypothetical protein
MIKVGTVLENKDWKIKVYAPPLEHGPAHVHVLAKGSRAEVKISLLTLEMIGKTSFDKRSVKKIIRYIYKNYDFLYGCWEVLHGNNEATKFKKGT